jgi:hypothetical protein
MVGNRVSLHHTRTLLRADFHKALEESEFFLLVVAMTIEKRTER